MYQLIHPSSFFTGLFAFRLFEILSGVTATLICSAGHDRPSRACSAPSSTPNDLKCKAIVAKSCRGLQVENTSSPREPAYPFISSYRKIIDLADVVLYVHDADMSATDSGENRAFAFAVESHTPTLVLHPKELTAEWVGEQFYPRRS